MKRTLAYITLVLLLAACGGRQNCTPSGSAAPMMPDYTDITLPCNIAPLNFEVEGADALRLEIVGGQSYRFRSRGPQLRFPMKAWKAMLQAETGDPKYRPHPLLRKMVRGGLLGVKSGLGFFTYTK